MTAIHILDGLERLDLTGDAASDAARLGFLEWVFGLSGEATADRAARALDGLPDAPESDAGQAFVSYLQQASVPVARPRRRTGRARRLH